MRSITNVVVGVLGVVAFTVLAVPAAASTIRTNASSYTAVAARTLALDPGGLSIQCDITFALGISSTSFTAASLPANRAGFGTVTGRTGTCDGGFTLTLLNQPWSVDATISGGVGVPIGTSNLIVKNAQFQIANAANTLRCLYAGDLRGGFVDGASFFMSASAPFVSGSILCPSPGVLAGFLNLSPRMSIYLS